MDERPAGLTDGEVAAALRAHWSLAAASLDYLPVGFGGYHWKATERAGGRWFVTANRIATDAGFDDLSTAMTAAIGLADRGLDFVLAPVPTATGLPACRVGRYAITVFPFIDGVPSRWGDTMTAADRAMVTRMLAALHQAQPGPDPVPVRTTGLPGRAWLGLSPRERARPWRGGPYAAATWELLSEHTASLQAALASFDELAAQVATEARPAVLTHGEPHPGNLIRSAAGGYLLIDWDSMGLAVPERDLWWVLSETGAEADLYAQLTGRAVSEAAVALYRLRWDLEDAGLFVADLRSARRANQDTEKSWASLSGIVARIAADIARIGAD